MYSIEGEAKIKCIPIHNAPANKIERHLWNYKEKVYQCKNTNNLKKQDYSAPKMITQPPRQLLKKPSTYQKYY